MVTEVLAYFGAGLIIWAIAGMIPVMAARRNYVALLHAALLSGLLWLLAIPVLALGVTAPGIAYVIGAAVGEASGAWYAHWREDKRELA